MPGDGRDYKMNRDDRKRERDAHLARRRVSGEALDGGRSEAKTVLASESGLAETETIAEHAVNAVTYVEELSLDLTGGLTAEDTYGLLVEAEVTGGGYPVLVRFTDRCIWAGSGFTGYSYVRYRLRILEPNGDTLVQHEQYVIEWYGLANNESDIYDSPNLTVTAELRSGALYTIQVHVLWHSDAGGDSLGSSSYERRLTIQDLKR